MSKSKSTRFVPTSRLKRYDVVNEKDQDLGQVETFIVDMREGLIALALVSFGGTLGTSGEWFALPWGALKWHPETMKFILDMPQDVLKNAPGMEKNKWLEAVDEWRKEEDLALIDRYYAPHGYESYLGIVRLVSAKRGRLQQATPAPIPSLAPSPEATPVTSVSARFVPTIRLKEYDVINEKGKDLGQVQTFVMDMQHGLIAFSLVAFGGTLGISDKWFALPWGALTWHPETRRFILNMPEDILKNAPGMDKNKWLEVFDKWRKEEDLALIEGYYTIHGYESYLGIVRLIETKRGRLQVTAPTSATAPAAVSKPTPVPGSVTIISAEAYNPMRTQHTFVAQVKAKDGSPVPGASVEWILGRAPGAVGDIVSLDGNEPQKVDNTYGVVKTDDKGEARLTITAAREGDIDVIAYVPGIKDPAVHKQYAVKHWLDLTARFPNDAVNAIGTNHVLIVQTVRVSDGMPVGNVPVRFTITGNDPKASFKEAIPSSNTYTSNTDPYGFAAVTLQQVKPAQGTNTVRIEILAPSNPNFVVLTKEVTAKWLATKLGLTKVGPEQIPILGQAAYDIKVQNTGDLAATGVVLTDEIPAGMRYVSSDPAGKVEGGKVIWKLGSLNIAESRSFKLVLQGTQAGLWTNTVVANSKEVGTATAQTSARVLPAPEVAIKKTGPSGVFTGFTRTYTLAVTNTGAVALTDVVVTDYLPELLSYKSSIPAGTVTGNQIAWNLGTLNIGETKQIVTILGGVKTGTSVNKATVTTHEGVSATDSLNITVLGAPGAHMSLLDSSDPVAVGDELIYTIKVLNQSKTNDLHNMTVVGLVPGETVYASADGPTSFKVVGQEVRFGPVAALKPQDTVEFHIKLKATTAGAAVFSATMRWDEFGEPIVNQEGTTIFLPRK